MLVSVSGRVCHYRFYEKYRVKILDTIMTRLFLKIFRTDLRIDLSN